MTSTKEPTHSMRDYPMYKGMTEDSIDAAQEIETAIRGCASDTKLTPQVIEYLLGLMTLMEIKTNEEGV